MAEYLDDFHNVDMVFVFIVFVLMAARIYLSQIIYGYSDFTTRLGHNNKQTGSRERLLSASAPPTVLVNFGTGNRTDFEPRTKLNAEATEINRRAELIRWNIYKIWLLRWLTFDTNPLDSLLQGLVGACGISVLCSLLRLHLFLEEESWSDKNDKDASSQRTASHQRGTNTGLVGTLQFFFVTGMLAVVGSRVASLVVLEFCLRAVSGLLTAGPEHRKFLQQLLVQSQFSLGCALSCSLHFLHEGASQRWLCLLLAAALSWFLARQATQLLHHVTALYKLHSSQRYCGICICLLTSGRCLLPMLRRTMIITFFVAVVASISIINQHFLSATEALRFWTPLTICYTLLIVYMQEEQHRLPGSQAVLNTVVVRLGGLMVLMLTVGRWADVLHILMCFLGEASCLIPTKDLLDEASSSQDEEDYTAYVKRERRRRPQAQEKDHQR